jgi:hypothetical protein
MFAQSTSKQRRKNVGNKKRLHGITVEPFSFISGSEDIAGRATRRLCYADTKPFYNCRLRCGQLRGPPQPLVEALVGDPIRNILCFRHTQSREMKPHFSRVFMRLKAEIRSSSHGTPSHASCAASHLTRGGQEGRFLPAHKKSREPPLPRGGSRRWTRNECLTGATPHQSNEAQGANCENSRARLRN